MKITDTSATGVPQRQLLYTSREFKFFCAILFIALIKIRMSLWPIVTPDTQVYFLPWLEFINSHGHLHALKYPLGEYFPLYLYLLAGTSYLGEFLSPLGQIKLIPLLFDISAAVMAYRIVKQLDMEDGLGQRSSIRPLSAFLLVFALPSFVIDGALWGQCDSLLITLLLATIFYSIRRSPVRAALCFGVAFGFKIQAIFLGPFLLLLLLRGRFRYWHILLVPIAWAATIVPILIMGRPLRSVFHIFTMQSGAWTTLSVNAANIWSFYPLLRHGYTVGLYFGIAFTILTICGFVYFGLRKQEIGGSWLLFLATTSLVLVPYIMPKMHDRYFLPGQICLAILACYDLQFLLPAALLECALILPYINFLLQDWSDLALQMGGLASTAVVYTLVANLIRQSWSQRNDCCLDPSVPVRVKDIS